MASHPVGLFIVSGLNSEACLNSEMNLWINTIMVIWHPLWAAAAAAAALAVAVAASVLVSATDVCRQRPRPQGPLLWWHNPSKEMLCVTCVWAWFSYLMLHWYKCTTRLKFEARDPWAAGEDWAKMHFTTLDQADGFVIDRRASYRQCLRTKDGGFISRIQRKLLFKQSWQLRTSLFVLKIMQELRIILL